MTGTLTSPAGLPCGPSAPAPLASPTTGIPTTGIRTTGVELDDRAERAAGRAAQFVEAGPGCLGGEHRVQPFLRTPEGTVGTTADLPGDRLHQPGQLGGGRDGDQGDVGPAGDIHRGDGGLPLLGGKGGHRGHLVDRRPAQRHVQAVVGYLRGRRPGQHHQAARRGTIQVGEALGQPDQGNLPAAATATDPPQRGQG